MLGSAARSHSQVIRRSGRPNDFRKYELTLESGSCKARQPGGYPGNAVGAAQDLVRSLDDEEFNNLIEQVSLLLQEQGVELPDWKRLSEDELRKIAIGAFYLQDGKLVLLPEG